MAETKIPTKRTKSGTRCAYKGCRYKFYSESGSDRRRLFRFPQNKAVSEIWIKNSCRDDLLVKDYKQLFNVRLCSIHFDAEMFYNSEKKRLLPQGIPKQYENAICPTVTTNMLATDPLALTSSCKKRCNVEEELYEERAKEIKILQNIPAQREEDEAHLVQESSISDAAQVTFKCEVIEKIKLEQEELIIKDEPEEVEEWGSLEIKYDANLPTLSIQDHTANTEIKVEPLSN